MENPHLRKRGTVRTISKPVLGEFSVPGFPMGFSQTPVEDLPAPFLGQHNAEVLTNRLGYSAEQVSALEAQGILHREPATARVKG